MFFASFCIRTKASPLGSLSFGRHNVMDVMHYFTGLVRFHIRPERRQTQGTRLESYRKLKTENAYAADSSRYLEAKRAKFKEISKINKSDRKR